MRKEQKECIMTLILPKEYGKDLSLMIRIEHLKKEYPNVTPLKDVSVTINDGDVISVIGPSGTGKSTLLRCINRLDEPTSGRIYIDDEEITAPKANLEKIRQKMGMVFQSFNLFGHLTVIENIMMAPMELLGKSKEEAYEDGMRLLREVGLSDKENNYPDELSGGQKQRIAIARTLAMDPEVILFDEPTSALDPTMVGEVQAVIRDLTKTGKTLMIVTHEMNFARSIANRVFYMDEGGIYEDGTPDQIFDNPIGENTRRFIRKLKILEISAKTESFDFPGAVGQIDDYCRKNQISAKKTLRLHLVTEETIQMLAKEEGISEININAEYSEATEGLSVEIRFAGRKFDVLTDGDELAVSVIKGEASAAEYSFDEEESLPNKVLIRIE